MDLEAVLELMRGIENHHLGHVQGGDRSLVQWHIAQRCSKNIGGACGATPIGGLLIAARRRGMKVTTLDLRNSGDTAGVLVHCNGNIMPRLRNVYRFVLRLH